MLYHFQDQKKIIVEEYISTDTATLHGDAFFLNGKMVFCLLGDHFFHSNISPLKPSATLFPSRLPESIIFNVENRVATITKQSGFKHGPVNVEARVDKGGNVFIMEIGPRSGGVLVPQAINYCCGVDMMHLTLDIVLNHPVKVSKKDTLPTLRFSLHSNKGGIFKGFELSNYLKPFVKVEQLFVKPGEIVKPFSEAGSTLGVLILTFPNFDVADICLNNLYQSLHESLKLA